MYGSGRWPFKNFVVKQVAKKIRRVFDKIVRIQNRIQNRIRTRNFEFWDSLHEILSPSKAMDTLKIVLYFQGCFIQILQSSVKVTLLRRGLSPTKSDKFRILLLYTFIRPTFTV